MKKFFILVCFILALSSVVNASNKMNLSSPDFQDQGNIPQEFTCQGKNIHPTLQINNVPLGTKSLALIVDDPDAPMGEWVHWVVFNIDPALTIIGKNVVLGIQGINDFGDAGYGGPCPPQGAHRYFFKLYALDIVLDAQEEMTKKKLEQLMEGHVLEQAQLVGIYQKI
jgi:hypothetical protein